MKITFVKLGPLTSAVSYHNGVNIYKSIANWVSRFEMNTNTAKKNFSFGGTKFTLPINSSEKIWSSVNILQNNCQLIFTIMDTAQQFLNFLNYKQCYSCRGGIPGTFPVGCCSKIICYYFIFIINKIGIIINILYFRVVTHICEKNAYIRFRF